MVLCYDVRENALNILSIAPQIPSLVKLTLDPIVSLPDSEQKEPKLHANHA